MEFTQPALLSRDDILKILHYRHLHVHNMNDLTYDELLAIYKKFAMPLSKRAEKYRRQKTDYNAFINDYNYQEQYMDAEFSDNPLEKNSVEAYTPQQICSNNRASMSLAEKRQRNCDKNLSDLNTNDYQYQLSFVTKRIRINSL